MDPLPADIVQRLEAAKRQNQGWADTLNVYSRAVALLSEGTRVTLAGLGMSELDILKNIAARLGKLHEIGQDRLKLVDAQKAPANGAREETRQ